MYYKRLICVLVLLGGFISLNASAYSISAGAHSTNLKRDLTRDQQEQGQPFSDYFDTLEFANNPQNFTIRQGANGHIYIGNGNGIWVFDGVRWSNISRGDQISILDFYLSQSGRIYTGGHGDVGYFELSDNKQWQFVSISEGLNDLPAIRRIYRVDSTAGYLLFSSQFNFFYCKPNGQLKWLESDIAPSEFIPFKDKVLISTQDHRLFLFDPVSETKTLIETGIEQRIYGFSKHEERLIAYTKDRLFTLQNSASVSPFKTEIDEWLTDKKITSVAFSKQGHIAIATQSSGIALVESSGALLRFYNHNHGLKLDNLGSLFFDKEDSLWIGSTTDGVMRVDINEPYSFFSDKKQHILSASTVEFKQRTYVGALDGLFQLAPAQSAHEQASFVKIDSEYEYVMSFVNDSEVLLFAHLKGIAIAKTGESGELTFEDVEMDHPPAIKSMRQLIRSKVDPNIIYGVGRFGVVLLSKATGKWQSLGQIEGINGNPNLAHEASDGALWVGTKNGELYRRPVSSVLNDPFISVAYQRPENKSPISSFLLGSDSLFTSTEPPTIRQLDKQNNQAYASKIAPWHQFESDTLLSLVNSSVPNRAWFVTWSETQGIDRVGLLSKDDEKQGQEYQINFSPLASLKLNFTLGLYETPQNTLWVNSKSQIVRLEHDNERLEIASSQPSIATIEQIGDGGQLLFRQGLVEQNNKVIDLLANQNAIRLRLSPGSLRHANNTEYRYEISQNAVTTEENWSPWQTEPTIEIAKLVAGKNWINIQSRVAPGTGLGNLKIPLYRQPYWYQSWWGMGLLVFTLIVFVIMTSVGYGRFRNQQLRKRSLELAQKVEERTQTITNQIEEIEQKNKQLKALDESKERFFTNISHEFKTPLTLTIGPLKEFVNNEKLSEQERQDHIAVALENSVRMQALLDQVLDINRLSAGHMTIQLTRINLIESLDFCIDGFKGLLSQQDINLSIKNHLPTNSSASIYFDLDHLQKILNNLISNAIKYSPPKSTILITLKEKHDRVEIAITDSGIGIEKEFQDKIFERYFQSEQSTYTSMVGTGIGLSLVKELVELHGSEILLTSEPGKGSCFRFYAPLSLDYYQQNDIDYVYSKKCFEMQEEMKQSVDNRQSQTAEQATADLSDYRKTLLVVEDNEQIRSFVASLFRHQYDVLVAENGRVATQIVTKHLPDIIVSDVMMPIMNGFELVEWLKSGEETRHIPVILLTAKSTKTDLIKGLTQGADDYLSKPFDSSELIVRVSNMLAQQQRLTQKLRREMLFESPLKPSDKNEQIRTDSTADATVLQSTEERFFIRLDQELKPLLSQEKVDLDELSQTLSVSRRTFFRRIKKRFDCSPMQLIKNQRLALSLELLQGNRGTISEVAYAVGFVSLSSFSRAFTEKYGVPPSKHQNIVN